MNFAVLAGMVLVSIVLIVYAFWPRSSSDSEAVKRRMAGQSARDNVKALREQAKASVAKRVMETVAPIAMRPVMMTSPEEMSKLRLKLANAGFRGEKITTTYLASKTVLAVCLGLAALGYVWFKGDSFSRGAGITLLGAGFGFLAPDMWLKMAISKRGELLRKSLPDSIDMMVISVEAGLGLDAAIQRVGDEMKEVHPVLAEELQLVTLETQMGIPRSESLDNFAARMGIDEAKSLVGVVNQAERFGTSIASALRRQSEALRVKRRQAAEEKAQKTTVKLMLPLVLFIFPAIFVVLAGPAALTMLEALASSGLD